MLPVKKNNIIYYIKFFKTILYLLFNIKSNYYLYFSFSLIYFNLNYK